VNLRERNALFKAISEQEMDPAEFELKSDGTGLEHPATGSWFRVGEREAGVPFSVIFRHTARQRGAPVKPTYWVTWNVSDGPGKEWAACSPLALEQEVQEWATEVKYVASEPDRWADLRTVRELLTVSDSTNERFTAEEHSAIAGRIDQVKQQVQQNPDLSADQVKAVEQKLDELVDASKRVGKKDWRVMLYGYAFGMIANDAVPPHLVQSIIMTVAHGLGHILGIGGAPPQPLP